MSRYLLDTNTLSEALAPRPDRRVLERLERHSPESAICTPVLHELRFGGQLLDPSRRREAIERFIAEVVLALYPVLPYDQMAAEWHADERARLTRLGKPPPHVDSMIAAIASVNGLILVTANVRDFKRFEGLQVESWKA